MTRNHTNPGTHWPSLRAALLTTAAAFMLASASNLQAQGVYTWTGADGATSGNFNWSDSGNWTVSPSTAPTLTANTVVSGGNYLFFQGTVGLNNTNDLQSSGLLPASLQGISVLWFATSGFSIYGDPISTATNTYTYVTNGLSGNFGLTSLAGTNTIGMIVTNMNSLYFNNLSSEYNLGLSITGLITGPGEMIRNGSSQGYSALYLLNPNNNWNCANARNQAGPLYGNELFECQSGWIWFSSMNTTNNPSAMGKTGAKAYSPSQASYGGAPFLFGGYSSSSSVAVNMVSPTNCTTDVSWAWIHSASGTGQYAYFSNNSPNNANLTFLPNATWTFLDMAANPWQLFLGGTSTGTEYFYNNFSNGTGAGTGPAGLAIGSPGTFVFSGNYCMLTAPFNFGGHDQGYSAEGGYGWFGPNSNATVVIMSNEWFQTTGITLNSGSTLDVTWNDTNTGVATGPFTIGTNSIETLTAGRIVTAAGTFPSAGTDIYGSLLLAAANPVPATATNGASLNVAGTGTVGTLTISAGPTESPVVTPTFAPGGSTIFMDFGTNTIVGQGSNDLIVVNGNLDMSQGVCTIYPNVLYPSAANAPGELNGLATVGSYTVMTYSGTLIPHTGGGNGFAVSPAPSGYATPVVTVGGGTVTVKFTAGGTGPEYLKWTGLSSANWNSTDQNWVFIAPSTPSTLIGTATTFAPGDLVTFDDSASVFSVNVPAEVHCASMFVTNTVNPYSFTGTANIDVSGTGTITVAGTSSTTLNTAQANILGATPVLSSGTLLVGAGALGGYGITIGDANTGGANCTLYSLAPSMQATVTPTANIGTLTIGQSTAASTAGELTITFGTNNLILFAGIAGDDLGTLTGTGNVTSVGGNFFEWLNTEVGMPGTLTVNGVGSGGTSVIKGDSGLADGNTVILQNNSAIKSQTGITYTCGSLIAPPGTDGAVAYLGFWTGYTPPITTGYAFGPTNAAQIAVFNGSFSNLEGNGCSINYTKTGPGTEVFTSDNSGGAVANPPYPVIGTNIISQGTLELDNGGTGSGLPLGPVTVSAGATLDGAGTIELTNGNLLVDGTLAATTNGETSANVFNVSALDSSYTEVASGGTLAVNLWSGVGSGGLNGNGSCDEIAFNVPVSFDGGSILTVVNKSPSSAFTSGDSWRILTYQNSVFVTNMVTVTNLPALPGGLQWDTSALSGGGAAYITVIPGGEVAPTEPPTIYSTGISKAGGVFTFTGTNVYGPSSTYHYVVLMTTNLNSPRPSSNWTPIATNSFNSDGSFSFSTGAFGTATNAAFFTTKTVE